MLPRTRHGLAGRLSLPDQVTLLGQHAAQNTPDHLIIINDQNGHHVLRIHNWLPGCFPRLLGQSLRQSRCRDPGWGATRRDSFHFRECGKVAKTLVSAQVSMNPYVTAAEYFANPPEKLAKWQSLLCSRQISVAGN